MNRRIARVAALAATLLLAIALGAVPATAATTGNAVDRAFVREMVPHHELAVEMARMAQTQADHQEVKTLAASIIRSQSREIRRMKAPDTQPPPAATPPATTTPPATPPATTTPGATGGGAAPTP